jgi:antitoxin MazE
MAHLIKIGNSQGIRIPQPLIKQARLDNAELSFQVVENGLLITPAQPVRTGWEEQFCELSKRQQNQDSHPDHSAELPSGETWEW